MAKAKLDADKAPGPQSIEDLQKRFQALNTRKIQTETELKNARERLEVLKKQSRQKYQTDDIAELAQKLATMKKENEEKRARYQAELERIEGELSAVESKFAELESAGENMEEAP